MTEQVRCLGCRKLIATREDGVIYLDFKGLKAKNPEELTCPHNRATGVDVSGRTIFEPCGTIVQFAPLLRQSAVA